MMYYILGRGKRQAQKRMYLQKKGGFRMEHMADAVLTREHGENQILMNAHDLQAAGIPRALAYQLLNRSDMPVVQFGRRKFMIREKFMLWLAANNNAAAQ